MHWHCFKVCAISLFVLTSCCHPPGVRCERASAYLNQKLGSQLKGVYQLKGGIEAYMKEFQDGGFFRGKNFVFDKREAISADNPDGDGGILQAQKKKKKKDDSERRAKIPSEAKCCVCDKLWDRYVGKKKCSTCGVPVLMCDTCMSQKPEKRAGVLIRCPLCVEQNVTVLVQDIELTDNGIHGVVHGMEDVQHKAAPSVLKWGGGHAASKKERRKFRSTPCRFGAQCNRPDCFFSHPADA